MAKTSSPLLLVSARTAKEAQDARLGGADIVDLKEPGRGSLGAVTAETALEICQRLQTENSTAGVFSHDTGSFPVSLAMGELSELAIEPSDGDPAIQGIGGFPLSLLQRFKFAKVGLAGCARTDWMNRWVSWYQRLPPSIEPVFVIYADWEFANAPSAAEVLQFATNCLPAIRPAGVSEPWGAVLLDTWGKDAGGLFDVLAKREIEGVITTGKSLAMRTALAGSLNAQTVAKAVVMRPDVIAVRGAVCRGDRTTSVVRESVAAFRARWTKSL